MWSSTDTEILKMLVCTYEPHTTKVGWWHWYTMKEFKIKIKTQKQFLVQMNLTYYSLKLQLLTEYTHTHTQPNIHDAFCSPTYPLSFMFILFPFTRLVIPFTQLWSNFFSNSTFYTDMKSSATYTDLSLLWISI